jgi:glucokinase
MQRIPTHVLTDARTGLIGLASVLEAELKKRNARHSILELIQRTRPSLSPAERRVADLVLTRPRTVLTDPLMDIASHAQVSQPTVIRFCRSLGLEGLSEFRLQLAATLSATVPLGMARLTRETGVDVDPADAIGRATALLQQYKAQIGRQALDEVVALLDGADRVLLLVPDTLLSTAQELAVRLMHLGLPCAVLSGAAMQQAGLKVRAPGDLALCLGDAEPQDGWRDLMTSLRQSRLPSIAVGPEANAWARLDRTHMVWPLPVSSDRATRRSEVRLLLQVTLDLFCDGLAARRTGASTRA